jgi:protocatechuate 3,4-dioxygenase beta subunit
MHNFTKYLSLAVFSWAAFSKSYSNTINWGSQFGSVNRQSDGTSPLTAAFTIQMGKFTTGFTPDESNVNLWAANWFVFDAAEGSEYNPAVGYFSSKKDLVNNTVFQAGDQAYVWIYDDQAAEPGSEWLLYTNYDWTFPVAPAGQIVTPLSWRVSNATTAVFGAIDPDAGGPSATSVGGGGGTLPATAFHLQTRTILATVPEPAAAALWGALGLLMASRRRRPVAPAVRGSLRGSTAVVACLAAMLTLSAGTPAEAQTVTKQLYLSDPAQALDRIDPVATADGTTAQTAVLATDSIAVAGAAASSNAPQTATSYSFNYDSGTAGTNRVLMVAVSYRNRDNEIITAATYNGVAMTQVGTALNGNGAQVYIYSMVNPPTGSRALAVTWDSALNQGAVIGAITYAGVNQTTPTGTFASATGTDAAPTVTVAGAAGRLMFGAVAGRTTSAFTVSGGTSLWSSMPFSGQTAGAAQSKAGAASVPLAWTGVAAAWVAGGVSLIPSSLSVPSVTFTQAPAFGSAFVVKAGAVSVSAYPSIVSGAMPANPAITAQLSHGGTGLITLASPTYNSGTGLLTWTGTMAADTALPSGSALTLDITTAQPGVEFRIDYDSLSKASKIQLTTSTYINVETIGIYTSAFPGAVEVASLVGGQTFFARIAVSDPFGAADVNGLNLTINNTLGAPINAILGPAHVVSTAGTVKTYEYSFTSPAAGSVTFSAIAYEGYEGTVNDNLASSAYPIVSIDAANDLLDDVEFGSQGSINVLANDLGSLNPASLVIITGPQNGTLQIGAGGLITYLANAGFSGNDQFTYQICNNRVPVPDCDTAIVDITVLPDVNNPCAEAVLAKTYYMPFPETATELKEALFQATNNYTLSNVVRNITSIKLPYPSTVLTYDEWEDGYEANITTPVQATTKIWGDGNLTNGVAPGYPTDRLPAGASIVLDNSFIWSPRNPANIYFDGKDKLYSTGDIAVSKVTGDNAEFAVQSAKTDVEDTTRFGKLFRLGLGEITGVPYFAYASLFIRASKPGTIVNLDLDANGTVDATRTLAEGEVWFYQGDPAATAIATATDVKPGTIITSSQAVGVDMLFGGNDNFGTRTINILPGKFYGNTYYSPVPSSTSATAEGLEPAVVYFVNGLNTPITINWQSGVPASGSLVVPAKSYNSLQLANSTTAGYKFQSAGGEVFTAVEILDAEASGSTFDWAITLVSANRLTDFASIAWAPGSLDGTRNDNPIWVTPTANTTLYIKYDGNLIDPTATMSPCGVPYDIAVPLNALNIYKVLDPDNNQSGVAIYTCDGTKFAAAYGEDATTALTANPSLDVGTILSPKCLARHINAVENRETTRPETPIIIGVAENDTSFLCTVDPATVSTAGVLQPAHGTVIVNGDGTLTYLPNPGFSGVDVLEYKICSAESAAVCDIARVYITVTECGARINENLIKGVVFVEQQADNAAFDIGENPAAGIKVDLYGDTNSNGLVDSGELLVKSTITDLSGNYEFGVFNGFSAIDNMDPAASFSGNDGSTNWTTNWLEQADDLNLATGDVRITADALSGSNVISLSGANNGITRSLTFSGATSASLTFRYRRQALGNANEAVNVQLNGSTIYTIGDGDEVGTDSLYQTVIVPLNVYNANGSNTVLFVTNGNLTTADFFLIDDVELRFAKNPAAFIAKVDPSNTNGAYAPSLLNTQTASFATIGTCDYNNYLGVVPNMTPANDTANASLDNPIAINVLNNDTAGTPNPASVTTAGLANQPANGTVSVNGNGTITYTPNPGFIGTDDFEYRVYSLEDPAVSGIALVTVTVSCSSIPHQNVISGVVFNDNNLDGVLNVGETGHPGVVVNLFRDLNSNGMPDSGDPLLTTRTTSALGTYQFAITPPSTTSTYLDQFAVNTTANQSNGTTAWGANSWIEAVETDGFAAGDITITAANGLTVGNANNGAARTANLSTAIAATLSFNFNETGLDLQTGDYVDVMVATSASPASWTLLKRYTGADGNQTGSDSFDITAYMSATTTVRFMSSAAATMIAGDSVFFDNVQIAYQIPAAAAYIVQLAQPIPSNTNVTAPAASPTALHTASFTGAGAGDCQNNFGLLTFGSITGTVLADNNNNGSGDVPLANVVFTLLDASGAPVDGNPNTPAIEPVTATSNAAGVYTFTGLLPGTYGVAQTQPSGYFSVSDADGGNPNSIHPVIVVNAGNVTGMNFVEELPGTITGLVLADTNNDDFGDSFVAGAVLTLQDILGYDIDNDPATPGIQPTTAISGADGSYTFTGVMPGDYQVIELDPPGYASLSPNFVSGVVVLSGATTANINFIDEQLGNITGFVLADTNNDDIGDTPIAGVLLTLLNEEGDLVDGDPNEDGLQIVTAISAADGSFSFANLSPGTYGVEEEQPSGYLEVSDSDGGFPNQILPVEAVAGTTTSGLEFIEERPGVISGTVFIDSNLDGTGDTVLPGVTVRLLNALGVPVDNPNTPAVDTYSLVTLGNGSYTFTGLAPGDYRVVQTQPAAYANFNDGDSTDSGDDDPANADTIDNSIPVTVFGGELDNGNDFIERPLATLAGRVLEAITNEPIQGASLTLYDNSGNPVDGNQSLPGVQPYTVLTGADGSYAFPNLQPGTYQIRQTQPAGYASVDDVDNTADLPASPADPANASGLDNMITATVAAGETDDGNEFFEERLATISGAVFEDTDNNGTPDDPMEGVTLTLADIFGTPVDGDPDTSGVQLITAITDAGGTYSFVNIPPGDYTILQTQNAGMDSVSDGDTTLAGDDSANTNLLDNSIPVTVAAGEVDDGNDFVDENTGSIAGLVQEDTNHDGTGDLPVAGITIKLLDSAGNPVDNPNQAGTQPYTTVTDAAGAYLFTNLPPGDYQVGQTQPSGFITVSDGDTTLPGDDAANSSPADNLIPVSVLGGETDDGNTFLEELPATIQGLVAEDTNNDGAGDAPLPGVSLTLYHSLTGLPVDNPALPGVQNYTVTTAANGSYSFTGLMPGSYQVGQAAPAGFIAVLDGDTTDPGDDSTNVSTLDLSIPVQLMVGETDDGNAFTLERTAVIVGNVLLDADNDNDGDSGMNNVTLSLLDAAGDPVDNPNVAGFQAYTATSAADGSYQFANIAPGSYQVQQTQPSGTIPVAPAGAISLTVQGGVTYGGNDFINEQTAAIAGTVKLDTNNDNLGDAAFAGVTLALFDGSGNPVDDPNTPAVDTYMVTSNSAGGYSFNNLAPGAYQVRQTQPAGFSSVSDGDTTADVPAMPADPSNASILDNAIFVTVAGGETDDGNGFTERALVGSLSGFVLEDSDNNNTGDHGIQDVSLTLLDSNGTPVDDPNQAGTQSYVVQTGPDGSFSFSGITTGTYQIQQSQPSTYFSVSDSDGGNPNLISAVALSAGGSVSGLEFVEERPGSISGSVLADNDNDGLGDSGIEGVVLTLLDAAGAPVDNPNLAGVQAYVVSTTSTGSYSFTGISAGHYRISESQPAGYLEDSDADGGDPSLIGNVTPITLVGGAAVTGRNFVEEQAAAITGFVRNDTDNDGIGDAGLAITLTLLDINGEPVDGNPLLPGVQLITATTQPNGSYIFADLRPGTYQISGALPPGYLSVADGDFMADFPEFPTDPANLSPLDSLIPVNMVAGETDGGNDFLFEASSTLSGIVQADIDNDGNADVPLAGVAVHLLDGAGLPVDGDSMTPGVQPYIFTTGADGIYAFTGLAPGSYQIAAVRPFGFLAVSDGDTTSDGTSPADGANASQSDSLLTAVLQAGETDNGNQFVFEAAASVSGSVVQLTPMGDAPVQGAVLSLRNAAGASVDDPNTPGVQPYVVTSDFTGAYSFMGLAPGVYQIVQTQPDGMASAGDGDTTADASGSPADPANASLTDNLLLVNLAPGETDSGNTFSEELLATISGFVLLDNDGNGTGDAPFLGATVTLLDSLGNPVDSDPGQAGVQPLTVQTNAAGFYTFPNILSGTYSVFKTPPAGYYVVADGDTTLPGDDTGNASQTDCLIPVGLLPGEVDDGNTFLVQPNGTISGFVAADTDNDNVGDLFVSNVTLQLFTGGGSAVDADPAAPGLQPLLAVTDGSGYYAFVNVNPGSYLIRQNQPVGFLSVSDGDGSDAADDSPANTSLVDNEIPVTILPGEIDTMNSFLEEQPGTISGFVLKDTNNDDDGDTPLAGITLTLRDSLGNHIDGNANIPGTQPTVAVTTANGSYTFIGVPPGQYRVVENQPADFFSISDVDGGNLNVIGDVVLIIVNAGMVTGDQTFVEEESGTITGAVLADTDNNNSGDTPMIGVELTLRTAGGQDIDSNLNEPGIQPTTLTTDGDGHFTFYGISPGSYQVVETDPPGYLSLTPNTLGPVLVSAGIVTGGLLFVDEQYGSISGTVLADTDNDDVGDSVIEGVLLTLKDTAGNDIDSDPNTPAVEPTTTFTDEGGSYFFAGLAPGAYQVVETDPAGYLSLTSNYLTPVGVNAGQVTGGVDFLDEQTGSISGTVLADTDNNNSGDVPVGGVLMTLRDALGQDIDSNPNTPAIEPTTTLTLADGSYLFAGLTPGIYQIVESDPAGFSSVTPNAVNPVVVAAGATTGGVSFVDEQSGGISGFVLADTDNNDTGDTPIAGVLITLKNAMGTNIDSDPNTPGVQPTTTLTAANGSYSFAGLSPGIYGVVETQPAGYTSVADADGGNLDQISPINVAAGLVAGGKTFVEESLKPGTLAEWQTRNPLGGQNAPAQNPDGDIYNNLLEYAFCFKPDSGTAVNVSAQPAFTVVQNATGGFDAVLTRGKGLTDVATELQFAAALGAPTLWTGNTTLVPVIVDNMDGTETLTWSDLEQLPGVTSGQGYFRIAVLLDANGDGNAEAVAHTPVQGWLDHGIETQCATYSNPFLKPEFFSGTADAASPANALNVSGSAGLTSVVGLLTDKRRPFVEILSGPLEGHRFAVDTVASDSNTFALLASSTMNTISPIPDLSGAPFIVRESATFGELFPTATFQSGGDLNSSDNILTFNTATQTWKTYFLANLGPFGTYWVDSADSGGPPADQNHRCLDPAEGVYFHRRGAPLTLPLKGVVRENDFRSPLKQGLNLTGLGYPVDHSYSSRGMTLAAGFDGDPDIRQADQVLLWAGDATTGQAGYVNHFLLDAGAPYQRWVSVDDSFVNPLDNDPVFEAGRASFIQRRAALPGFKTPAPWTP